MPRFLRLTFGEACSIAGDIEVLARGIPISSLKVEQSFEPGQFLDLPVNSFPNVQLPVNLCICVGEEEIAAPLLIKSSEDVMALVGQGEIEARDLSLEAGLLRGTLHLNGNAVSVPNAFIRTNGVVIRSVVVEPPVGKDTGGAYCRFAVPIRPSDFVESGLSVDLHVSGIDHPLANFTYARVDPSAEASRLLKLEEELRQAQKKISIQTEMLSGSFQRRLALQQERVDAFIEYATSILLDNVANAFEQKSDPASFLLALSEARANTLGPTAAKVAVKAIDEVEIDVDSENFAFGWYDVEQNDKGPFRWMSQTGLLNNPYPHLPLAKVDLVITRAYGAEEPLVRAVVDDVEFTAITTSRTDQAFNVSWVPPQNSSAVFGQSVRLESFHAGSPATSEGTNDTRILAIAATKAKFYYRQDGAGAQ
ncbi:hypothetical protein [Teichococcus aestuarii]|uniref:hypothetical protein n=1 Tax=Teichococcus aestuarii TaxID=568898 RepID=UPI0036142A2D